MPSVHYCVIKLGDLIELTFQIWVTQNLGHDRSRKTLRYQEQCNMRNLSKYGYHGIKVGSPTLNQLMRFFIIKPAVLSCAKYKLRVFSKLFLIVRVPRPFWQLKLPWPILPGYVLWVLGMPKSRVCRVGVGAFLCSGVTKGGDTNFYISNCFKKSVKIHGERYTLCQQFCHQ